jgi:type IV pilus assembly protein PilV
MLRIEPMFVRKLSPAIRRGAAGFTLVEILVAMTIFAIGVLGLAAGTMNVLRTNSTSQLSTSAINLAQSKIEELRAMSAAAFAGLSSPGSDTATASGKTFNRTWQITANSPVAGVTKIDVTVGWTDYTSRSVTVSASVAQ